MSLPSPATASNIENFTNSLWFFKPKLGQSFYLKTMSVLNLQGGMFFTIQLHHTAIGEICDHGCEAAENQTTRRTSINSN